jgi:uncharacterized protein (DUF58 family)
MPVFDESTLHQLERLALIASQVRAGQIKGERRSTKRGTSIEFADYRNYTRGDDPRRVDWNVYARLERPFIKLLEEEEDLAVHVLLDTSTSMDFGDDARRKFLYAQRLAGALGYMALAAGDRLTVTRLPASPEGQASGGQKAPDQFGPSRGRGHILPLLAFLEGISTGGQTDLETALRLYALSSRRPGLAFLVSDMFSPSGFQGGLTQLQARGYEVCVVHLLAPDEIDTPYSGDLRLVDSETGRTQEVTLDGGLRAMYRRRVLAWRDEIEQHCLKHRANYVPVVTDLAWDELVLYQFRQRGLVR